MSYDTDSVIPRQVRDELSDSFTEKGIRTLWAARWRLLDNERLCDMWDKDPDRCMGGV
jgi:hypothetical protein